MLWLLPPLAVAGYLLWRKKNADNLTNEYDSSGQPQASTPQAQTQAKAEAGFVAEPPKPDLPLAPEVSAQSFVAEEVKNAPLAAPPSKASQAMALKAGTAKPKLVNVAALRRQYQQRIK
jgi:hypothetical protein